LRDIRAADPAGQGRHSFTAQQQTLRRHDWHGDWNCTLYPGPPAPAPAPAPRPGRGERPGRARPALTGMTGQRLGAAHRRAGRPVPGPARSRPPHRTRRIGHPPARRRPPPGNDPRRENPGHHHAAAAGSTPARPGRPVRRVTAPQNPHKSGSPAMVPTRIPRTKRH